MDTPSRSIRALLNVQLLLQKICAVAKQVGRRKDGRHQHWVGLQHIAIISTQSQSQTLPLMVKVSAHSKTTEEAWANGA